MIIFIIVIIASFLAQLLMPWWIMVAISFLACGLLGKTQKTSFWGSFFAIFVSWCTMCLIKTIPNENLLSSRVAELFGIKFWWALVLITSLLGGFVAGISGLCGYHFRKQSFKNKSDSNLSTS